MAFDSMDDSGGPVAAINVTPLVDVMLVMLVIFMVTAPMMQQGVDVNLPKAATGALKGKEDPLVLSIDKVGDVYLGEGNKVPLEEIGGKIKAVVAARGEGEKKVFIKADTAIEYGRVMEVMGRLHEGGITEIGLVSAPPESRSEKPQQGKSDSSPRARLRG